MKLSPAALAILAAVYATWLAVIAWMMTWHWSAPLIVFMLGAVLLHISVLGSPLRALVRRVQVGRGVTPRCAQQLTFAVGFVLVAACTPFAVAAQRQAEARELEARRLERAALARREAVAHAEREAAEAKRAAEQAMAEQLAAEACAQVKQQRQREEVQRQERERREEGQRQERERQEAAKREAEARALEQLRARDDAARVAQRRAEEGPYDSFQAQQMCMTRVAKDFGLERWNEVIEQGSYVELMDRRIRNTTWGNGHMWWWRPKLKNAYTDEVVSVLCRVYDDGRVEVIYDD
ncbi:hypothetical protein [Deinococcus yavapaiensis]|uniref:Uncharacterized protein n=1 Tax=Deinococcus yavapaiensis KR-236 TaxID=694435 RepID=A0A318S8M5_9DEIO|nr:hypothetical protein [Deinococcus yavapaiensis]PYE51982.1 hypothetical protein DES52_11328 [Deinococcus yavapaiensis KR-236]